MTVLTVEAYDRHARTWAARHPEPGFWDDGRQWLAEDLPPPARIIEFGTGSGKDARELIAAGYDYTGVDASAGLAEVAREAVSGITIWQMDVRSMVLLPGAVPFDGFWCAAVLMHLERQELPAALRGICAMVRPGASGFISVKSGDCPDGYETCDSCPSPRYFAYWDAAGFRSVLEETGFDVLRYELRRERWDWHKFLVRVREEAG